MPDRAGPRGPVEFILKQTLHRAGPRGPVEFILKLEEALLVFEA